MPNVNQPDAFAYRVDFAARVISSGSNTTRTFDSCFENHDGDAVAVALYRRSRKNPLLRRNLFRYVARDVVLPVAFRERRRTTRDLASWSIELRDQSRQRFAAMLEEQAKRNAALR